jgi:hypothetical protein
LWFQWCMCWCYLLSIFCYLGLDLSIFFSFTGMQLTRLFQVYLCMLYLCIYLLSVVDYFCCWAYFHAVAYWIEILIVNWILLWLIRYVILSKKDFVKNRKNKLHKQKTLVHISYKTKEWAPDSGIYVQIDAHIDLYWLGPILFHIEFLVTFIMRYW